MTELREYRDVEGGIKYDLVNMVNRHAIDSARKQEQRVIVSLKAIACTVAGGFLAAFREYFFAEPKLTAIIAGGVASVYIIACCMRKD